ncbi:chemerin-like receptor 1 [Tiliqua scincoides]|uniref:chemerin-like receptor 1 n=1 Tax=Tiliqua scincoides TaxID=71010 RepID=UPI0034620F65
MESTAVPKNLTILGSENLDVDEMDLMVKRMRVFSIVTYSLFFVLGTTGNGLVIFITSFQMKKTVNTVWILNLAIADFTFSFFQLFNIVSIGLDSHWPFGYIMCKLNPVIIFFNLFASIYLLVVISIDRCIAVWCPVWAQNHRTTRLASFVVLGVWILAFVLCSPDLYFMQTYYVNMTHKVYCVNDYGTFDEGGFSIFQALTLIRFIFGFIIPFSVIVVCYGLIVVRVRRDKLSQSNRPFKVITAVIVAFFVCWFPFHFFSLLKLDVSADHSNPLFFIGLCLSSSLVFFNSCLNPILYFCMGHNFKEMLRCSLLSALANAFTEESHHHTINTRASSSAELESHSL